MRQTYSGSTSSQATQAELRHRALSRTAAAEGMVLLENNGVLPLSPGAPVSVYGAGALFMNKGGTGSGDVNDRDCVSVAQGLENAGVPLANRQWLDEYRRIYGQARGAWRDSILAAAESTVPDALLAAYLARPFLIPPGPPLSGERLTGERPAVAVYVLSRQAGEGADRTLEKGSYSLSDGEREELTQLRTLYRQLVVVLNCGGPVDLREIDEIRPDALLLLSQPGMEGGNALAEVLLGRTAPSGKLTDTWAKDYRDYPSAATFLTSEDASEEYREGIYVGYRYFDTFGVAPRFPFGFGLSYTSFQLEAEAFQLEKQAGRAPVLRIGVTVTNTGATYSGREVVQVYCQCPQGRLGKERQRLCGFAKTGTLRPGASCRVEITVDVRQLCSYSPADSAYLLEKGTYLLTFGSASHEQRACGRLVLREDAVVRRVEHVLPCRAPLQELQAPPVQECRAPETPVYELSARDIPQEEISYRPGPEEPPAAAVADSLSLEQLACLVNGEPSRGQDVSDTIGSSALCVPGAAGETSGAAAESPWNLRNLVLADGPAGIRLAQKYVVLPDGRILRPTFAEMQERGLFAPERTPVPGEIIYYQFCTSFPVGTMLAQTWDTALVKEVGRAVAEEMVTYGIDLWLAPGMNIHRNPLCGRNFEYYSEDPLLTGTMAAALTAGVQENPACGVTIKHFACNQRETQRRQSDSRVSERALREIYLPGFEIAVKAASPVALMTSYNLINGVHTANSVDLITKVLRGEWGFTGLVMSDWTTTGPGGSSPVECMRAGNDLIMPGTREDAEQIRQAVQSGELPLAAVKACAARLVRTIWRLSPGR